MPSYLYAFVVLVCPVVMGVMMWMMMRDRRHSANPDPDVSTSEVARLRAEVDELRSAQLQADGHGADRPMSGD